ncbi:hypothetical protein BDY21DRAFT_363916 [Lineolata rhizophorae]|uniref:Uncharacterized protein n=1 Tax=Lineolata rhizophorae TaxID=578093 RepID=A0A6A6P0V1_9PEZI|nr:hypothetical protein BDY21DRAFT_363916 [Lineolata rhizophorae]
MATDPCPPSPLSRSASPPPWTPPSLAISACPQLDRSVSTASSVSSVSGRSSSDAGTAVSGGGEDGAGRRRRRGYMRPQATVFADSAKQRESVMSLGSIAHLQYYFARTGLLDGKGAQLAREAGKKAERDKERGREMKRSASGKRLSGAGSVASSGGGGGAGSSGDSFLAYAGLTGGDAVSDVLTDDGHASTVGGGPLVESPIDEDGASTAAWDEAEPVMLPPTVSTYNHRPAYVPPPPDMNVLRRELREALDEARNVLKEVERMRQEEEKGSAGSDDTTGANGAAADGNGAGSSASDPAAEPAAPAAPAPSAAEASDNQGWHELQGMRLLDVVTLAIRAAKNYYTSHDDPQKLYALKPERALRAELYGVLDVLRRMAARGFAGGARAGEVRAVLGWADDIAGLLRREDEAEKCEEARREGAEWRVGDWAGREREREWLFLRSFDRREDGTAEAEELPAWTDPGGPGRPSSSSSSPAPAPVPLPTPFLAALRSGLRLVRLHNACVRASRRHFEEIRAFHADTGKPYRCADNLRYWLKAAELRWDARLRLAEADVMAVVRGDAADRGAWLRFDAAVMRWCKAVREEITAEWELERRERERKGRLLPPPMLVVQEGSGEVVGERRRRAR